MIESLLVWVPLRSCGYSPTRPSDSKGRQHDRYGNRGDNIGGPPDLFTNLLTKSPLPHAIHIGSFPALATVSHRYRGATMNGWRRWNVDGSTVYTLEEELHGFGISPLFLLGVTSHAREETV